MPPPAVRTRITTLLQCKYPILLPGMSWISTPELVAAVSNAGGCGILATGPLTHEETRQAIHRIRSLTDKPFGIGATLLMPGASDNAKVALDEQVPLINVSLGKPDWIATACREYGGKVMATVTNAKHGQAAMDSGADALMITGHEAAAHGGDVTSLVAIAAMAEQFPNVPLVAAGGFANGRGLAAALALGADAVAMGSRLAVTQDSPLAQPIKEAVTRAGEADTIYGANFDGIPARVLKTKLAEQRMKSRPNPLVIMVRAFQAAKEMNLPLYKVVGGMLTQYDKIYAVAQFGAATKDIQAATVDGNVQEGVQFIGQCAGLIHDIPTVEELMQRIMVDATETSLRNVAMLNGDNNSTGNSLRHRGGITRYNLEDSPIAPRATTHIGTISSTQQARMFHTTTVASMMKTTKPATPQDAATRAKELVEQQIQQQQILLGNKNRSTEEHQHLDTLLAHAGLDATRENAPMAPPLQLATTYTRPVEGPYRETDSVYTREDNPTRRLLEKTMAQLECSFAQNNQLNNNNDEDDDDEPLELPPADELAEYCCAFSSGMMAASSILLAHKAPLVVLLPQDVYHGVPTLLHTVLCPNYDLTLQHVDMTEVRKLECALEEQVQTHPDRNVVVWMETPSNPKIQVLDVQAICQVVDHVRRRYPREAQITTVVDSTLAPPVLIQPLQLGADVVMHAATKWLGGHSDVLLGLVTASPFTPQGRMLAPMMRHVQAAVGGVASPMDSWLTLRGLKTLHVRMERASDTAARLAHYLLYDHADDVVGTVHYPGLAKNPYHELAQQQLKQTNRHRGHGPHNYYYGGVLSLELESETMAMAFCAALRTMQRATSLGGTETLVEHRASTEPPGRVTSPPGLVRISVGLEDEHDLICDVDRALKIALEVQKELL